MSKSERKPGVAYKSIFENGVTRHEEIARDEQGFSADQILGHDEYRMLTECGMKADTNVWRGLFTYPNCGSILFERGWVTERGNPTDEGYLALEAGRERFTRTPST